MQEILNIRKRDFLSLPAVTRVQRLIIDKLQQVVLELANIQEQYPARLPIVLGTTVLTPSAATAHTCMVR